MTSLHPHAALDPPCVCIIQQQIHAIRFDHRHVAQSPFRSTAMAAAASCLCCSPAFHKLLLLKLLPLFSLLLFCIILFPPPSFLLFPSRWLNCACGGHLDGRMATDNNDNNDYHSLLVQWTGARCQNCRRRKQWPPTKKRRSFGSTFFVFPFLPIPTIHQKIYYNSANATTSH